MRRIARDELGLLGQPVSQSPSIPISQSQASRNMFAHTRTMISGAARSALGNLDANSPSTSSPISTPNLSRSVPNHPWRSLKRKASKAIDQRPIKFKLLNYHSNLPYRLEPNNTLLDGIITLNAKMTEQQIREEITASVNVKFPTINSNDLEFFQAERNTIKRPSVKPGYSWNYKAIKTLIGSGKLYTGLTVPLSFESDGSDSSEFDWDSISGPSFPIIVDDTSAGPSFRITVVDTPAGPSSFPITDVDDDDYDDNEYLPSVPYLASKLPQPSLKTVLEQIKAISKEKHYIRIDEEQDCLREAITYFKLLKNQTNKPLKIVFNNQAACDAGGVTKQFLSNVFKQMGEGVPAMTLFEGSPDRLLPIYNIQVAMSSLHVLVGVIFRVGVMQGPENAVGPAFLSPACYEYICTGDFESSTLLVSKDDCTARTKSIIDQVSYSFHYTSSSCLFLFQIVIFLFPFPTLY